MAAEMNRRFYYLGKAGDMYGWGVCNANLQKALARKCDLLVCNNETRKEYESPVFVPIADHDLNPIRKCRAPFKIGYTFFEMPLGDQAVYKAQQYDLIFAGSSWCEARLRERGINNVATLVQGVDFERFKPQPWDKARKGFRIFSGGKWEYRKGQDIVIAAMGNLMKMHPDICLLAQWHNPWPATTQTMRRSTLIKMSDPLEKLDKKRFVSPPPIPNEGMPGLFNQIDVGVFPNRCEGGTNLVLMECMASGRPVIATNATGHLDVLNGEGPIRLESGMDDEAGWRHIDVSELMWRIEELYQDRAQLETRGAQCRKLVEQWTWDRAAETILEVLPK